ncbi:MAG: methyltransferase domain-containing protein [Chloroflexi bacterium]|nr:methyltransferase domain-containing protein [Chloroflexota bacterium]
MMVRLDFTGRAKQATRALRVATQPAPGVTLLAEAGPHLPFADTRVDEIFGGRSIAWRDDIAATLDEIWRVCKPGALVHLTLPHASSVIAVSRDARPRPLLSLNTFNFYDPRTRPAGGPRSSFTVERARLRIAGDRGDDTGLALARGPFAQFIEKLANGSRGSQYRFERWFAGLIGGFEEFDVVLAVVKQYERGPRHAPTPDASMLRVTSDVAHEATVVEPRTPVIRGGEPTAADPAPPLGAPPPQRDGAPW